MPTGRGVKQADLADGRKGSKSRRRASTKAAAADEPSEPPPQLEHDVSLDRDVAQADMVLKAAAEAGSFEGVRAREVHRYMAQHRVEEKLAICLTAVLGEPQLRWSPYPSVVRMLRRQEMRSSASWPQTDTERARLGQRAWDESASTLRSGLETRLNILRPLGACAAELAPLIDPRALERLQRQLQPTGLLDAFVDSVALPEGGELHLSASSAIGGSALWAPRLVGRARALEVCEHLSASGPPGSALAALHALQARIVATVRALDSSQDHMAEALEVYAVEGGAEASGDGDTPEQEEDGEADTSPIGHEHDAPPLTTPTTGYVAGAVNTRWDRLLHFPASELRKTPMPAACARAIRQAAMAGQPIHVHALTAVSIDEDDGPPAPPRRGDEPPPRFKYAAVQKSFVFAFTSTGGGRGAARSEGEPAPIVQREVTPPPLALLFSCAWPAEGDAAGYLALPENRRGAAAGRARLRYAGFLRRQLCRSLIKGEYVHVAEAVTLLLPHLSGSERLPLFPELATFLGSDAVALAAIAHAFATVARTVLALADLSQGKAARVVKLVRRQWLTHCRELSQLLLAERSADLTPLEPMLRRQMADESDRGGSLLLPDDGLSQRALARRLLALARSVASVSRQLCDTLMLCCRGLSDFCKKVFTATPEVQVPLSLQPVPVRERRIDLAAEQKRLRPVRAYPDQVHEEAVLLQYVTDSRLDAVVEEILVELTSASRLPRNPFTVALLRMKRAAAAFEAWREADASLANSFLSSMAQPAPQQAAEVPGCLVCRVPPPGTAVLDQPRRRTYAQLDATAEAMRALHEALLVDTRAVGDVSGTPCLYGHKHRLVYADRAAVLRLLRDLGPEVLDVTRRSAIQQYETFVFTAFVDVPYAAEAASAGEGLGRGVGAARGRKRALPPYEVSLREDHFIRGKGLAGAIAVHCTRVVSAAVAMHRQTTHMLSCVTFGAQRWSAADIAGFPKQAAQELIRHLNESPEAEVVLHASLLVAAPGADAGAVQPSRRSGARYVAMRKSYAMIYLEHGGAGGMGTSTVCIPPRRTQSHESIFLSHAHASVTMLIEVATGGGAQARWQRKMLARGAAGWRGGDALAACGALLESRLLDADAPPPPAEVLAPISRLLCSPTVRVAQLVRLSAALRSVVEACTVDENRSKCSYGAVNVMLDAYRSNALALLSGDECVNLEAGRRDVQEAFYLIFEVLQATGEPTSGRVREQLELCDDILVCVGTAAAAQLIENAPELVAALDALFGPANAGRDVIKHSSSAVAARSTDGPKSSPTRPPQEPAPFTSGDMQGPPS
jgi:hypothetical protein